MGSFYSFQNLYISSIISVILNLFLSLFDLLLIALFINVFILQDYQFNLTQILAFVIVIVFSVIISTILYFDLKILKDGP